MVLRGIKVVEVSIWVAGPSCGMWLAENGADVIRVEPIDGDVVRRTEEWEQHPADDFNWRWEMWNRSKRGIALDLRQEEGRQIVHKLVAQADVFLANLRPHTLQKAGLDYETLSQLNPRLIYAQITGYGSRGPGATWAAYDDLAFWARSGIGAVLGEPGETYVNLRGAIGDHSTAVHMLGGIGLALYDRERTGRGQQVEVSLLGSGIWANAEDIQAALLSGREREKPSRKTTTNPLFNTYQCQDGKWVVFDMPEGDRYWSTFCQALGLGDIEHDARFNSFEKRAKNHRKLIVLIEGVLATKTRDELEPLFYENGLVWGRVQTPLEVAHDPCAWDNGYIVEYEHPSQVKMKGLTCPIQLGQGPARIRHSAPEFNQHTEEILLEIGYSQDELKQLRDKKVIPEK